jgi:peptidoglycan hydrolase CwlO-like protein
MLLGDDMREKIENRIEELSKEIQSLVGERTDLLDRLDKIEVRVHQIAGSIGELHNLLVGEEDGNRERTSTEDTEEARQA